MSCAENNKTSNLEIPLRSDIDAKYKWDMTAVYPTEEAWEDDLNLVKKLYPRLGDYKGRLLSSPEVLLESIELRNQVNQTLWKLYHYASNSSNADVRNEKFQEMVQRVINESVKIGQTTAYYTPEILQNEYSVLEDLMANNTKLQVYEKQFKDLYISKPHILTEKEEKLLTMAGKLSGVSNDAYDIMRATDFVWPTFQDEDGNELTMSQGRYGKYTKSTDRRVREDMYKALYVPFKNNINTMSVLMKGNVEGHIFYSEARNYESTLEARMKRDGMSTDVYKNLINSVNDNLQPLHRWAEIKAKYLGLEKIKPFDTYAPLADSTIVYTYEEAQNIVLEALDPLLQSNDGELRKFTEKMYNENLIDVFESQGKQSGAYMSSTWGLNPRVKLNFAGTLDDIFTLAHELGHAYHSYLSQKNQPYAYYSYTTFNAEAAAITTEALLMDYLLANAKNDEEKAFLIQNYIQSIGSTYYRQTRFAEFELLIHEAAENGQILTEDFLTESFGEMYSKYWGPYMEITEEEAYSWSRIPHFYYNYYVYTYATSFAAAEKISENVRNEGQDAIDDFISYLSTGSSDYPVELLKIAGADMTTSEPFEAVSRKMNFLMDELESILK
jgi:oligoendopeptidase F|tara:strand:+ start:946 stop:2781 length:1836 start_codon:yes stop_codon:yes gene_type:complete